MHLQSTPKLFSKRQGMQQARIVTQHRAALRCGGLPPALAAAAAAVPAAAAVARASARPALRMPLGMSSTTTTSSSGSSGSGTSAASPLLRGRVIAASAAAAAADAAFPRPGGDAAAAAAADAITAAAGASAEAPAATRASAARPQPSGLSKLLAHARALLFAAWTFTLAVPLFCVMLAMSPIVLAVDKFRRLAQHYVNDIWAAASTAPFYRVTVVGAENLPPPSSPAVYVANHQSFMDIYSLFRLRRPFKFISKTSNFVIPIVGWSMFLTGHVMLNRVDRRSQLKCLSTCIELLGKGASVLFFPEGTRSKDKVMAGFKKGAFSVACKAKAPVVPVTLVGTGDVMPSGREGEMYARDVTIVIHPPIATDGGLSADAVCAAARAAVASALPAELRGDPALEAPDSD